MRTKPTSADRSAFCASISIRPDLAARRDHPRTNIVAANLLDVGNPYASETATDPFEPMAITLFVFVDSWLLGWKIGRRDLDPVGMQRLRFAEFSLGCHGSTFLFAVTVDAAASVQKLCLLRA